LASLSIFTPDIISFIKNKLTAASQRIKHRKQR
jgi:hypothetical protein